MVIPKSKDDSLPVLVWNVNSNPLVRKAKRVLKQSNLRFESITYREKLFFVKTEDGKFFIFRCLKTTTLPVSKRVWNVEVYDWNGSKFHETTFFNFHMIHNFVKSYIK